MTTNNFACDFAELSQYLRSFALRLTNDVHQAEDLYQDTALRAFRHQNTFAADTNMKAWLSTIMKNIFINNFRSKKRRGRILEDTNGNYSLNPDLGPITNEGESKLNLDEIHRLINELDDGTRIPFLMAYQGFRYDEISEKMNLPLGTIKSRIFIARKRLKAKITGLKLVATA